MSFIRNWKVSVPAAGIVLAGLAWLAFGFFGVHTAFIDDKVDEALPEFDVPAAPAADTSDSDAMEDEAMEETDGDAMEDEAMEESDGDEMEESEGDAMEETDGDAMEDTADAEPVIVTEASGDFSGQSRYDVTGQAIVLGNGTGQRFLRFEDFESSNGPDLNVYLFNPDDSSDFIDLGDLKGNVGEQNYEIPADVDLDRYSQVSIWCVRFGVGFGNADLAAA